MGETLPVSAVRNRPVGEVVQGICALVSRSGVTAEVIERGEADPEHDALVSPSQGGWTIISWPLDLLFDPDFYQELSKELDCLISTAYIYDGGSWTHILAENGKTLDRFASHPDDHNLTPNATPDAKERLRQDWRGDAEIIAAHLGVIPGAIRPYLVQREAQISGAASGGLQGALKRFGLKRQQDRSLTLKAFPDDEYALNNCWVFVDFWRRLGIQYTQGEAPADTWVRFPPELLTDALLAELTNRS